MCIRDRYERYSPVCIIPCWLTAAFLVTVTPPDLYLRHCIVNGGRIERDTVIPGIKTYFQTIGSAGYAKTAARNKSDRRNIQKTEGKSVCPCSVKQTEIEFCFPSAAHRKINGLIIKYSTTGTVNGTYAV